MENIYIFKRYEKKYRISYDQKKRLLALVGGHLTPDEHGKSTVYSIYLDTPDYRLIRESITAGVYKEKMRLRCYGEPVNDSPTFLEIKKKYKGVVYKRRESLSFALANEYIKSGNMPYDSQIMREIDYMRTFYGTLRPAMLIACEREAYFSSESRALRLTFDSDIRYSSRDFSPKGSGGTRIINDDEYILEIKTDGAMPLWLSAALSKCEIFSAPFSKYGTAYKDTNYPLEERL